MMKVMKFGGTSVGSPDRMRSVIPLINDGEQNLVVLSAMSGTTNSLVEISDLLYAGKQEEAVHKIGLLREKYHKVIEDLYTTEQYKYKAFETVNSLLNDIDGLTSLKHSKQYEKIILSKGELMSSSMFYYLLLENNIDCVLLPALNFMRIDKDGEPDTYYIAENFRRELDAHPGHNIIITQGFICRNAQGETDNLKRGGSDFTASLLGAAVNASEIQIWTDINGFHNNDPRLVENTEVIREISFDEAAELAYFGAKILHPSSVNPAREKNIPVRLKNTMDPHDQGTIITSSYIPQDYKAVAAKDGISAIRIHSDRMLMAYGFMRKVFEIFETYKTPIDMVATSEVSVSITVDDSQHLDQIAHELQALGSVEIEKDQTIICIVGDFRADKKGSAPEIFEALNSISLKMISYGGSSHSLSLLIDTKDKTDALRLLHKYHFNH
jgi:aspartate kinase